MKISAIEAIPFAIPYAKPLRFADCKVRTAEGLRVHTDGGLRVTTRLGGFGCWAPGANAPSPSETPGGRHI